MLSDSSFVGFERLKMVQPSRTATNRPRCASPIAADTEGRSPASPTAGSPSCHPEEEAPSLIAAARLGLYVRQRPGGNRSTDRSDERSTARPPHHRSFPPRADAASQ